MQIDYPKRKEKWAATKYTSTEQINDEASRVANYDWTSEGIEVYNEYCIKVTADRNENNNFEDQFKKRVQYDDSLGKSKK